MTLRAKALSIRGGHAQVLHSLPNDQQLSEAIGITRNGKIPAYDINGNRLAREKERERERERERGRETEERKER